MKINPKLLIIFTTIIFAVFGALIGMGFGFFMYGSFVPLWTSREIAPLQGVKDIVQVDIQSTRTDPTQDIVYVALEDGRIFANTLFQSTWQPVEALPAAKEQFAACTSGRRDALPVRGGIARSAGFRFERPLSDMVRCYVLLEDGRLQVWTRATDMFALLAAAMLGGALGLIAGALLNAWIWRDRHAPSFYDPC